MLTASTRKLGPQLSVPAFEGLDSVKQRDGNLALAVSVCVQALPLRQSVGSATGTELKMRTSISKALRSGVFAAAA